MYNYIYLSEKQGKGEEREEGGKEGDRIYVYSKDSLIKDIGENGDRGVEWGQVQEGIGGDD